MTKIERVVKRWCLYLTLLVLSVPLYAQKYVADSSVANEEMLRQIPVEYINKARQELVIAYQHTSHGTHVARGVFGLQDYKTGDTLLFGVSESPSADSLEFRDRTLEDYAPPGIMAIDLSVDETAFIQTTRNYLDAPENATVNVVMWSWCNIDGLNVSGNYLPGMDSLINEYGLGGTMIGTGDGLREVAVTFIRMTGHANVNDNVGDTLQTKAQADTITSYSIAHQQYCLDYYSIDTHDMDDNYWEDAGDDGNSTAYGGNFYHDWQDSHVLGEHYYENKVAPGGRVDYGDHTTQHITSNRKAYAMWWILARIAGWDGNVPVSDIQISSEGDSTHVMTGDTLQFSALVLPAFATNVEFTWSVINGDGTATISSEGLLIGKLPGSIQVMALALDGSGVADTMDLSIDDPLVPVTDITVTTAGDLSEIDAGIALQCSAAVLPDTATNPAVIWSLLNLTGTGLISADGLVTGLSDGIVEVIATAEDGSQVADTIQLTVVGSVILVSDVEIASSGGASSVISGEDLQFTATVLPVDATNAVLAWSVINGTGSASITSGGLLTAGSAGTVEVVALATDGSGVGDSISLTINAAIVLVSDILISSAGGVNELDVGSSLQFTASVLPAYASDPSLSWSVINGTGTATICECAILSALTPGTVDVVASAQDASGISSTFAVTIVGPDAVFNETDGSPIILYPNPSMGKFYLNVGELTVDRLEVISAGGSVVLEMAPDPGNRLIEMDLSDRQPGVFFIRAFSEDHSYIHRIVISR